MPRVSYVSVLLLINSLGSHQHSVDCKIGIRSCQAPELVMRQRVTHSLRIGIAFFIRPTAYLRRFKWCAMLIPDVVFVSVCESFVGIGMPLFEGLTIRLISKLGFVTQICTE